MRSGRDGSPYQRAPVRNAGGLRAGKGPLMFDLALFAGGLVVTLYGFGEGWSWYWLAVSVAMDVITLVGAVLALRKR